MRTFTLAALIAVGLLVAGCGDAAPSPEPGEPQGIVGPTMAVAPTVEPPTDPPTEAAPTETAVPPTDVPTETPPTEVPPTAPPPTDVPPTEAPAPTEAPPPTPVPVSGPVPDLPGEPPPGEPWLPCAKGQIKGNIESVIYHVPSGASYARTYRNVHCFNSEAEAQAAGYRRAQR